MNLAKREYRNQKEIKESLVRLQKTKRYGEMFDFINEPTVFKIDDVVFPQKLRHRVVQEFAFCPAGSVLFALTPLGHADDRDQRLSAWEQVPDPSSLFRGVGFRPDDVQPLWMRRVLPFSGDAPLVVPTRSSVRPRTQPNIEHRT